MTTFLAAKGGTSGSCKGTNISSRTAGGGWAPGPYGPSWLPLRHRDTHRKENNAFDMLGLWLTSQLHATRLAEFRCQSFSSVADMLPSKGKGTARCEIGWTNISGPNLELRKRGMLCLWRCGREPGWMLAPATPSLSNGFGTKRTSGGTAAFTTKI